MTTADQSSSMQGLIETSSILHHRENATIPESGASKTFDHERIGPGRKSRACIECKRLKLKCEAAPDGLKCKSCRRRGVECVQRSRPRPRFSTMTDLDQAVTEDLEQKLMTLTHDIQGIKQTLETLLQQRQSEPPLVLAPQPNTLPVPTPPSIAALTNTTPQSTTSRMVYSTREDNTHMAMTRENSVEREPSGDSDNAVVPAVTVEEPMGHLYEVTRLRNIRSNKAQHTREDPSSRAEIDDFITRGLVSEQEALELYNIFHTSLNHYLWIGLEETHPDFASVRRKSELLAATILTVTALHIPNRSETFDKCYGEFLHLTSSSMFSRYHSIDDVRALCIAAFWLSEVSWKLSGHAIRIAIELNMHQSFFKALEGDKEQFYQARLWFMLYVCDHHFSVAYGRPPILSETLQIREHERFLKCPFSNSIDYRILSQVSLMQLLSRIHDKFTERSLSQHDPSGSLLSDEDFTYMRNFNLEIDQWRLKWNPLQKDNKFIGTFPAKGIILYSYFAKLQLNALAVRGIPITFPTQQASKLLTTERKEFANMAISAAASILTFVLEEEDMRRALVGTPLYVHTMITFASVFLMKTATKWNKAIGLNVDVFYISDLLERMVELLKNTVTSERHLIHHIAKGLEKMLQKSRNSSMQTYQPGVTSYGQSEGQQVPHTIRTQFQAEGRIEGGMINSQNVAFNGQTTSQWQQLHATREDQPMSIDEADFNNPLSIMNDGWIHEAFGFSEPVYDVYNLLTSQFSY